MAQATFYFPNNFLWGTATASHQVEGSNTNNTWYAWENEGHITNGDKSGIACDWWNGRWKEDLDRAANTHQNTHRFSVEWSRIQPDSGKWDLDALDYYREIAKGCVDRGLLPMVTLHHFSDPLWLAEMGGWENDNVVEYFKAFSEKVVGVLKEYVFLWCTINEPNVFAFSSALLGDFPPGKKSISSTYKMIENLIKAHIVSYDSIHKVQPEAVVGLAHHYRGFSPAYKKSPIDRWITGVVSRIFNQVFPMTFHTGKFRFLGKRKTYPHAKGTQDYFGLNYYTQEIISFSLLNPKELFIKREVDQERELSPSGFMTNEPDIFFQALRWAKKFDLPVYITENGVEDSEDKLRPKYLIEHLHKVWQGINFNWPIRGYYHWTLVDNFEWERGWSQKYGLWELDRNTQDRKKRKSADLYEMICAENALTSKMVTAFVPELSQIMFPG